VQQFALGPGYTILPYDPLYLKVIGQQVEWSFLDAKAVNSFYCDGLYRVRRVYTVKNIRTSMDILRRVFRRNDECGPVLHYSVDLQIAYKRIRNQLR